MSDTGDKPDHRTISGDEPAVHTCVTGEWQVSLVLSEGWAVPLPARFTYRADDPYAVRLDFYLTMDHPQRWRFARELLIAGALRPTGEGDVRVWPAGDVVVCLHLDGRNGEALLEIPGAPLTEWLERTCQFVAPGREHEHQTPDIDTRLRHLLGGGSPAADASEG